MSYTIDPAGIIKQYQGQYYPGITSLPPTGTYNPSLAKENRIKRKLKIESCEIPERMKELLMADMFSDPLPEVSKFIWDSLTPDEQFTCLMTFPDEIEQFIGKEE